LGPLQILRCLSSLEELPLSLHRLHSFFRNPMHLSTSLWISQSTKYRRKQMSWKTKWSLDYVSIPMRLVSVKLNFFVLAFLALFALLKRQAEKYCSLICGERKILFLRWKSTALKTSEQGLLLVLYVFFAPKIVIGLYLNGFNACFLLHVFIGFLILREPYNQFHDLMGMQLS
jgi:hypothetical protein